MNQSIKNISKGLGVFFGLIILIATCSIIQDKKATARYYQQKRQLQQYLLGKWRSLGTMMDMNLLEYYELKPDGEVKFTVKDYNTNKTSTLTGKYSIDENRINFIWDNGKITSKNFTFNKKGHLVLYTEISGNHKIEREYIKED
ncbi:hypothetical protein J7K25_07620 [bacterium]|nr:hypothetical protein [bacterium]